MAEDKAGFAFHCHHDVLMEWCYDFDERVQAIKDSKPAREQKLRLRLFKLIPPDRLPPELVKAKETYLKAREVPNKTREKYMSKIIRVHQELCPDCPWDGQTIFSLNLKRR